MVIVNTVSDKYFELNGIRYSTIFQPLIQGINEIGIYLVYDTRFQLHNSTPYEEYLIDGSTFATQKLTIDALLDVIYKNIINIESNGKVKASAADIISDYLTSKISLTGALKNITNPGANEVLNFKLHTLYKPDGTTIVAQTSNSGFLGLGIAPSYKLDLKSANGTFAQVWRNNDEEFGASVFLGDSFGNFQVYYDNGNSIAAKISGDGGNGFVQVAGGNFGVGIELPNALFDAAGEVRFSRPAVITQYFKITTDVGGHVIDAYGSKGFSLKNEGNIGIVINTDGHANITTAITPLSANTTLNATHQNKIVECNGTFTVTLPNSMPIGYKVDLINVGVGIITIAASGTLQSKGSNTKLSSQYGGVSAYHRGSNVWIVVGDLSA